MQRKKELEQQIAKIKNDLIENHHKYHHKEDVLKSIEALETECLTLQQQYHKLAGKLIEPLLGEHLYSTSQKAFLHWMRVFTNKICKYLELMESNLKSMLWGKLLECRVLGNLNFLQRKDKFLAYKEKRKNFKLTDDYLNGQFKIQKDIQKELLNSYNKLSVMRANRESAGSFTDHDNFPILSKNSKYLSELKEYLCVLTSKVKTPIPHKMKLLSSKPKQSKKKEDSSFAHQNFLDSDPEQLKASLDFFENAQ